MRHSTIILSEISSESRASTPNLMAIQACVVIVVTIDLALLAGGSEVPRAGEEAAHHDWKVGSS